MLRRGAGCIVMTLIAAMLAGGTKPVEVKEFKTNSKLTASLHMKMEHEAGPHRVWVFFTDKNLDSQDEYDQAITQLTHTYNQRAVQRRLLRGRPATRGGALFDIHDIPVASDYVQEVLHTGVEHRVTSSWLNAVSVEATADQISQIAQMPFVTKLQPVARSRRIEPVGVNPAYVMPGHGPGGLRVDYGLSYGQLVQINLVELHNAGYTGAGIIMGILDTGFNRSHIAFNQPGHVVNVIAEYDFVDDDNDTSYEPGDPHSQHRHGTLILGAIGAYMPGELVGGAYDASFILCKTEDVTDEYPAEEDKYVAGLQFIEANGGDMATSSLGYIDWYSQNDLDGQTAVTTIAVNVATANGMYCCTAAGNEYHDNDPETSSLIAPSDAFQVISCGAVDSDNVIKDFSSSGPTADDRVKPEVLARGGGTATVDPDEDSEYTYAGGTSLSTPLVAAAVACLVQANPDWSVDELRNMMIQSASDYVINRTHDPLFIRGYGVVNAYAAAHDCNNNDIPDLIDIIDGTSDDNNGNGIPDECETPPCPADLTGDDQVNIDDIFAVLGLWGDCDDPCPPYCTGDLTEDCTVNIDDIFAILGMWGPCE